MIPPGYDLDGPFDEAFDADGRPRPGYEPVLEALSSEPLDSLASAVRGELSHALLERGEVEVNSFHHQGVELPEHPFAVGVQWHAECLVDRDEHLRLFEGLTHAARDFSQSGRGGLRAA